MAEQGRAGFSVPLRVREFRSLWIAELVSIAGDQVARVALSLVVFAQTSSAVLTALTYGLTFVPSVLGGFLLSGLADRFPRRTVIVIADIVRAVLASLMAIPTMSLPALWVCVGLLSVVAGPFKAAHMSLIPQILERDDEYAAGVALRQFTTQAAQLAGFAGGGLLLVVVEPHVGMLVNSATFLCSAVLVLAGVRARPAARGQSAAGEHRAGDLGHRGKLAVLFGLAGLLGLYIVPEGLAVPYAGELGIAAWGVGLLLAADPAGSAIGAWLTTRIRIPTSPFAAIVLAAAAGLVLVVCGLGPGLPISVTLWALSGALSTAYLIQTQTMVVGVVPDRHLGRVMGRMATCMYCSQGIAVVLGGLAAESIGSFRAVAGAGLIAAFLALALLGMWNWTGSRRRRGNRSEGVADSPHHSFPATTSTSSQETDCRDGSPTEAGATPTAVGPSGDASAASMKGEDHRTSGRTRSVFRRNRRATKGRLFALRPRVVVFVVGVVTAAVVTTVVVAVNSSVTLTGWIEFGVLLGAGLGVAEATRYIERIRRQLSDTPHVNMSSVSILAVTMLAGPALGAATAILLYLHLWWRTWRWTSGVPIYRAVFNASVMILSVYAAWIVVHAVPHGQILDIVRPQDLIGPVLVIATFWTMNSVLVGAVIALEDGERSCARLLGSWSDNALEIVTLCIGVLTAALMMWRPWLIAFVLPTVYVLHRSVLVKHLEQAATTDRKTGLLNATSWRSLSERAFGKAQRYRTSVAVLMLDLDSFKRINDTHGHLVGDRVLQAVADTVRCQVRAYDLTGRFGGEEFVILLPDAAVDDAVSVAERICAAVRALRFGEEGEQLAELRVSVSIGVAQYPGVGQDLEELLLAADNAMFAAKQSGRDRVCVVKGAPPSPRVPQADHR